MITYEEALEIARTRRTNLNQVFEYEKAYVFSNTDDSNYIGGFGHTPVVVLKEDGIITNMIEFVNSGTGKEIGMRPL